MPELPEKDSSRHSAHLKNSQFRYLHLVYQVEALSSDVCPECSILKDRGQVVLVLRWEARAKHSAKSMDTAEMAFDPRARILSEETDATLLREGLAICCDRPAAVVACCFPQRNCDHRRDKGYPAPEIVYFAAEHKSHTPVDGRSAKYCSADEQVAEEDTTALG